MRKILTGICLSLLVCSTAFGAEVPKSIQDFINKDFPESKFRFDGAILLPDNTMYLPVNPAKIETPEELAIKSSYPENMELKQKPDMIILNNNFILLKVINTNGKKTVVNLMDVPSELQSGLLPQDILLPKGLILPENLKGIIGNLDVTVSQETGLRINNTRKKNKNYETTPVEPLENKSFYISTGSNKNIQVIHSNNKNPEYALEQDYVIYDIKGYNNEFLFVTYFDYKVLNIISLMDEKVIKQIKFETYPEQILIDENNKLAYVTSSSDSSIYVISLETMTLKRQLKINGMCEKFTLSQDGTKMFYVDRKTNDIWTIELDNNYKLTNIGRFPNVSKIAYANDKIYIISRTKSRLAIIDYETKEYITEFDVSEKPVDLLAFNEDLYILSAQENIVEVLNTKEDIITDKLFLNTNAFATNLTPITNSNLIMVTNAMSGLYSVIDTELKEIVKTSPIDVPVREIVITNKVKTIK